MRHFGIKLVLIFLFSSLMYQNTFGQSFHFPQSIVIEKDNSSELVSYYTVQPKNTLYSICKFYHCDFRELTESNPDIDFSVIEPGVTLKIPYRSLLLESTDIDGRSEDYIPVFYKTSRKDNLFRIARIYFKQTISELMERNGLTSHNLAPGQLVHIGWKKKRILTTRITDEYVKQDSSETEIEDQDQPFGDREIFIRKLEGYFKPEIKDSSQIQIIDQRIVQQNGLAIWNKESSASGIFALHNDAKPGTLLEIINPLLNRTSYVKVIGKIPGNTYPDNVRVILSPEAAKSLGALDSRFYVRMNYITE